MAFVELETLAVGSRMMGLPPVRTCSEKSSKLSQYTTTWKRKGCEGGVDSHEHAYDSEQVVELPGARKTGRGQEGAGRGRWAARGKAGEDGRSDGKAAQRGSRAR